MTATASIVWWLSSDVSADVGSPPANTDVIVAGIKDENDHFNILATPMFFIHHYSCSELMFTGDLIKFQINIPAPVIPHSLVSLHHAAVTRARYLAQNAKTCRY